MIDNIKAIRGVTYLGVNWNTVYIVNCSIATCRFKVIVEQGKTHFHIVAKNKEESFIVVMFLLLIGFAGKVKLYKHRSIINNQKFQMCLQLR